MHSERPLSSTTTTSSRLNLATSQQLEIISAKAREINQALLAFFSSIDVKLVDFKIEMGITSDGMILLADEITPDTCRLWDVKDQAEDNAAIEHLDKDLFRRDLGSIIPAYEEILLVCALWKALQHVAKAKAIATVSIKHSIVHENNAPYREDTHCGFPRLR
jgi:phosphoribosylaminoimidazole-succinocarboxamide synthase